MFEVGLFFGMCFSVVEVYIKNLRKKKLLGPISDPHLLGVFKSKV